MKKQNGFTLVELAIVLMIIGLLIGGVLRGQELMNNSRVTATIEQVKAYQGAFHTFTDMYDNYPGDMVNAVTKLPGCTPANNCINGNGDGQVGPPMIAWADFPNNTISSENAQFWKHLALAHLITGVDPSTANIRWGGAYPSAHFGGGFTAMQTQNTGGDIADFQGLIFRLQNSISGSVETDPAVSPKYASQIDRKMDDGQPFSGDVRASDVSGNTGTYGCEVHYIESMEDNRCAMYFKGVP